MMSNSNYSIGLQRLMPVHTAYGAICMPIRKLLMHGLGHETWPRPRRDRDVDNFSRDETDTRRWYVSRPGPQPCLPPRRECRGLHAT